MDKDTKALLLLTNRLLMDWISIAIDRGEIDRAFAEQLIDFSARQVVAGAPEIEAEVAWMADLFKQRLPDRQA